MYVHVARVRVRTCITTMCNADVLRVTLQEMRHDHVDVLVLLFSPAAHKAEVITASYRLWQMNATGLFSISGMFQDHVSTCTDMYILVCMIYFNLSTETLKIYCYGYIITRRIAHTRPTLFNGLPLRRQQRLCRRAELSRVLQHLHIENKTTK